MTEGTDKKRVSGHPLNFYVPADGPVNQIIFTGKKAPTKTPQYDYIQIRITKRASKNPIVVSISLLNETYISNFEKMVEYILQETKNCDEYNCADKIIASLSEWTRFLKRSKSMTEEEVQGLIGEMLFLKQSMIPKYGELKAVQSWTHPEKTKQDFMLDSTWYEIKTVKIGASSVKISSLEQLNSDKIGRLVVIILKNSTIESNGAYNLKKIYEELKNQLVNPAAKDLLLSKTIDDDIDNDVYESVVFEIESFNEYMIDEVFPKLTPNNVPAAVDTASYSLNIKMLEQYRVL